MLQPPLRLDLGGGVPGNGERLLPYPCHLPTLSSPCYHPPLRLDLLLLAALLRLLPVSATAISLPYLYPRLDLLLLAALLRLLQLGGPLDDL